MPVIDPIFIIGSPRSGTTLTAKILGRHTRLFMPGETHFFDDVYARRTDFGRSFDEACKQQICERLKTHYGRFNEPDDQKRVSGLMDDTEKCSRFSASWRSYADVLSSFMETQMRLEGKTRWGNNVPRDIFNIKTILSFYPQAKIIVCVRDIRDFLLSYKAKWKSTADEEVERLKKLYHPVVTSLLWKSSMKTLPAARSMVPKANLHIVRYEDLVADPEKTVRSICETIDEQFEGQMLEVGTYGSSHGDKGKGIFASSVGRWREGLSAEEVWIAQALCKNQMRELGYESVQTKVNWFRLLAFFCRVPIAITRGLHANRHKRGPLVPYLTRRLRAMIKG